MRSGFIKALAVHQKTFDIDLSHASVESLADYYDLVQQNNLLLHLVAPCSSNEFAVRHVLESLTLLEHLPQKARFADVGAGAGLPSIPCLLVREDLSAKLIESKQKKSRFLDLAVGRLGLTARATVINSQFYETDIGDCHYVTCRALDSFTERLPRLLKWAKGKSLLLFGSDNLASALTKSGQAFDQQLIPLSERRFLLIVND